MKLLGTLILVIGIVLAVYALNMNTNRFSSNLPLVGNVEIKNADLMSQKQNYILISGFLAVIGVILLIVNSRSQTTIQTPNKEKILQEKIDTYKGYKALMYIALAIIIIMLIMSMLK